MGTSALSLFAKENARGRCWGGESGGAVNDADTQLLSTSKGKDSYTAPANCCQGRTKGRLHRLPEAEKLKLDTNSIYTLIQF